MEVTHLLVVHLLVALSVHESHGNVEAGVTEQEGIAEAQQKVHDECRNPDYKKYLKCLMRPKRHHHSGHGLSENGRFNRFITIEINAQEFALRLPRSLRLNVYYATTSVTRSFRCG